uniref:Uncharacterized protein n=1 Tax=Spironucleus salmonicida TaxID=348837 RepID=V6LR50_9EUKA|eukprot:EST43244.1 Hypothetical protein SS50377_17113 [Spironucleus salmonicida]
MTLALPSCQADTDAPLLVPARVHSNRATHAGELPCRSGRWKEASATVRRGIPRCCTAPSLLRFTWQSSCFHADCGRGATGCGRATQRPENSFRSEGCLTTPSLIYPSWAERKMWASPLRGQVDAAGAVPGPAVLHGETHLQPDQVMRPLGAGSPA